MTDAPQPGRGPLPADALRAAVTAPGSRWREVVVLDRTSSTNTVAAERSRAGAPEGLVVLAEEQTAGRGRLDRRWTSPPGSGVTLSVLLRPAPELLARRGGWLPLLAGLAVAAAARRCGVDAALKWPNDVLVGDRKLAGVLAEVVDGAVVVGIGLNVTTTPEELPADRPATSLLLAGASTTDRLTVTTVLLGELADAYGQWERRPDELAERYQAGCTTLGRPVSISLPGGTTVTGTAERIDEAGRLVIDGTAYAAGDVVHLRPADTEG
ncbi:MAG: ligase [Mycobacterium sp.]|nr:ligase [Mycobacterium sp.]